MIDNDVVEPKLPAWLQDETLAEIAAALDAQLHEMLSSSSLDGALGRTLAHLLSVSKFDNLHEEGTLPEEQYGDTDDELRAITVALSAELKRQLLKRGASEEDVEYAVVRRWDMLAGSENSCTWSSGGYSAALHRWCVIKKCC